MNDDELRIKKNIIIAAKELFSSYGYKKTSMEDIAKAIHKGKSSIYYYFKNKEDIFRSVIQSETEEGIVIISDEVKKGRDATEKLKIFFKMRFRFIKEKRIYYNILVDEYYEYLPFIDQIKLMYDSIILEYLESILDEGVENKLFSINDTKLFAKMLGKMLEGFDLILIKEKEKEFEAIFNLIDIFYETILRAIRTQEKYN